MLVKVRNDDPSRLSGTERTVVNWLKSWSGPHAVPGIAIVQCQDADIVVWTPQTSVVLGVHAFAERVTGTLSCAEDEPWTVDGKPAPIDGDADPLERVRRQTMELAAQLRSAPGRKNVPVSGLVLLVPQLGSRVKLEKGTLPPGIDVLIGDGPSSLRNYFTTLAEGAAPSWDAAQVGQALGALGFAAAATYSDLVSEGFPPPESARSSALPMSAAPTVVVPSVPVQPEPPATPPGRQDATRGSESPSGPGGSGTGSPIDSGGSRRSEGPGGSSGRRSSGGQGSTSEAAAPGSEGAQQFSSTGRRAASAGAGVAGAAAAAAAYRAVTGSSEPQDRPRTDAPRGPAAQGFPQSQGGQGFPPGSAGQGFPQGPAPQQARQPQPGSQGNPPPRQQAGPPVESNPQATYSAAPSQPSPPGFPLWSNQPNSPTAADRPRRRKDLPIVLGMIAVLLILAVAAMCTGGSTSSTDKNKPTHQTSTINRPSATPTTDPTIPKTTIAPACFPLDPNC
ncbi:hypothetical protein GFY24_08550 [Nocardia sp. SYP-A9097]|uniref:hypothetical protein n=1 Tax=Nocardia sp. SYP-A9097 TaxID=2663237 RepID=UPI00129AB780|nr:hypothetical protein [Nocardia sp. SYP-A9097]MRH87504.1 hypothetical protein [Nocardia sp. SYP-A9097]